MCSIEQRHLQANDRRRPLRRQLRVRVGRKAANKRRSKAGGFLLRCMSIKAPHEPKNSHHHRPLAAASICHLRLGAGALRQDEVGPERKSQNKHYDYEWPWRSNLGSVLEVWIWFRDVATPVDKSDRPIVGFV